VKKLLIVNPEIDYLNLQEFHITEVTGGLRRYCATEDHLLLLFFTDWISSSVNLKLINDVQILIIPSFFSSFV
jgi:hypothetical protein